MKKPEFANKSLGYFARKTNCCAMAACWLRGVVASGATLGLSRGDTFVLQALSMGFHCHRPRLLDPGLVPQQVGPWRDCLFVYLFIYTNLSRSNRIAQQCNNKPTNGPPPHENLKALRVGFAIAFAFSSRKLFLLEISK